MFLRLVLFFQIQSLKTIFSHKCFDVLWLLNDVCKKKKKNDAVEEKGAYNSPKAMKQKCLKKNKINKEGENVEN